MPAPRKFVRKRRPTRRRNTRNKASSASIGRMQQISAVPDRMFVKLKYSTNLNFAETALPLTGHVFRMNSLNDPDFTGTGKQPLGFDQWSAFYKRYRVTAAKITVRAWNGEAAEPCIISLIPSKESTLLNDLSEIAEAPYARKKLLGASGGLSSGVVSNYMTIAKLGGLKSIQYENGFTGATTTNPVSEYFWQVYASVVRASGVDIDVDLQVDIIYYAEMYDRIPLAGS